NNAVNVDIKPLAGRKVTIWYDNDNPGLMVGKLMHERLRNVASEVLVCKIPYGKPQGWDIADCRDPEEVRAILESGKPIKATPETEVDRRCSQFNLTNLGNSERLVERHGNDIKYCYQTACWFIWNGQLWA